MGRITEALETPMILTLSVVVEDKTAMEDMVEAMNSTLLDATVEYGLAATLSVHPYSDDEIEDDPEEEEWGGDAPEQVDTGLRLVPHGAQIINDGPPKNGGSV